MQDIFRRNGTDVVVDIYNITKDDYGQAIWFMSPGNVAQSVFHIDGIPIRNP